MAGHGRFSGLTALHDRGLTQPWPHQEAQGRGLPLPRPATVLQINVYRGFNDVEAATNPLHACYNAMDSFLGLDCFGLVWIALPGEVDGGRVDCGWLKNAKNGAETVQFWFLNLWRVGLQAQSVVALPLQLRAIWEQRDAANGYWGAMGSHLNS